MQSEEGPENISQKWIPPCHRTIARTKNTHPLSLVSPILSYSVHEENSVTVGQKTSYLDIYSFFFTFCVSFGNECPTRSPYSQRRTKALKVASRLELVELLLLLFVY